MLRHFSKWNEVDYFEKSAFSSAQTGVTSVDEIYVSNKDTRMGKLHCTKLSRGESFFVFESSIQNISVHLRLNTDHWR